jgi:hypothetical protein
MLGYCVKPLHENNSRYISTSLSITAVYEYGEVFNVTTLSLSVEQRIKHVLDLAIRNMHTHVMWKELFLQQKSKKSIIHFDHV